MSRPLKRYYAGYHKHLSKRLTEIASCSSHLIEVLLRKMHVIIVEPV